MHRQLMLFYGVMAAVSAAEGIYLFFCIRRMLRFYGADVKKKKVFAANFAAAVFLAPAQEVSAYPLSVCPPPPGTSA